MGVLEKVRTKGAKPFAVAADLPLSQILRGDCIEAMRGIPSASIDMVNFVAALRGLPGRRRPGGLRRQLRIEGLHCECVRARSLGQASGCHALRCGRRRIRSIETTSRHTLPMGAPTLPVTLRTAAGQRTVIRCRDFLLH